MSNAKQVRKVLREAALVVVRIAHGGFLVAGVMSSALVFAVLRAEDKSALPLRNLFVVSDTTQESEPEPAVEVVQEVADTVAETRVAAVREEAPRVTPEMQRVADYLARKYRVSATALEPLIVAAHHAGVRVGVDPLIIVAVMAIESSFNPLAESPKGAQGLMQVIPRFHQEKLEARGEAALLDPVTNIHVGAQVLKESIERSGGLQAGLQYYAGASTDVETQYANKVMAEKQRLEQAARRTRNA
jgi:soluble lytic murein transglycosylase-like protein